MVFAGGDFVSGLGGSDRAYIYEVDDVRMIGSVELPEVTGE